LPDFHRFSQAIVSERPPRVDQHLAGLLATVGAHLPKGVGHEKVARRLRAKYSDIELADMAAGAPDGDRRRVRQMLQPRRIERDGTYFI
jgi:hypothetical protein